MRRDSLHSNQLRHTMGPVPPASVSCIAYSTRGREGRFKHKRMHLHTEFSVASEEKGKRVEVHLKGTSIAHVPPDSAVDGSRLPSS